MLVIRLAPVGRKNQPAYRIVLAEHSWPVNKKFKESLGFYNVSEGKKLEFDAARIEHWVNNGARPSDAVAALLKNAGVPNMEKFMSPRNLKRAKKNPVDEPEEAAAPAPAEGGDAPEAPAEEEKPAKEEEAPKEETVPSEEAKATAEEPAAEEATAEEAPAEEEKSE